MSVRLLLIGPPGAGKSTQGAALGARLGAPHIAVGELLRRESARDTVRGREIRGYVARAAFVPDRVVDGLIAEALEGRHDAFVLDGYPRTPAQAVFLDGLLARSASGVDGVLAFRAPAAELLGRLLRRGGADDSEEHLQARMAVTERGDAAVLEHYRRHVVELDARGDVDEVTERALDGIREALGHA